MNESWFELALIVFIVAGIAVAIWKGGQANPESTGSLGKKLSRLESDVRKLTTKVSGVDGKVGTIERQMEDIERRSAKASDIERLERLVVEQGRQVTDLTLHLAQFGEAVAAIREAGDQRGKQLDRLYDFIVERGMSK